MSTDAARTVTGDASMQQIFDDHTTDAADYAQDQHEFTRAGRMRTFGWNRIMARERTAHVIAHDERLGQPWKSVLACLLDESR